MTTLEQAAIDYAKINDNSSITNGFSIVKFAAFKAGAEWMKKRERLTAYSIKLILSVIEEIQSIEEFEKITVRNEWNFYKEVVKRYNELEDLQYEQEERKHTAQQGEGADHPGPDAVAD